MITEELRRSTAARSRTSHNAPKRASVCLFFVTLAIFSVRGFERAKMPFIGLHAFVSADVATTARTFAAKGIFRLHGVPVNNNPPILTATDAYTHWPPLLPILLSLCFRALGASERAGQLFMLAILLATAVIIFRLGCLWLGTIGGALAGYFWLTLPVVVQFGDLICQQALAMLFVVATLLALTSRRERLASLLLLLAVLSSWEATFFVPGIWLVALEHREYRKAAIYGTLAASLGFLGVMTLYAYNDPSLVLDQFQTAKYYMGLSSVYSKVAPHTQPTLTFAQQWLGILRNHIGMLGPMGIGAITQLIKVRPRRIAALTHPLAAPWVIWTAAMQTHTAIHHFELLIAAPLTAFALAWFAIATSGDLSSLAGALKLVILPIGVAFQLLVLPRPTQSVSNNYTPQRLIMYARQIQASTDPGSIVMTPATSAVPIYYSERHIVREVDDDDAVASALPKLRQSFPGAHLYVAIPPFLSANFPSTLHAGKIVSSTDDAIVIQL